MPAPVLQQHPNRNSLFSLSLPISLLIYIMYVSPHIYNMYEASPPSRPYCVSTIFHFSLFPKIRKCNSHSSFFILHSSFNNRVSAIFHFSLFTLHFSLIEEKVTPILHYSFYILHLRRATVSGALPPDIFPVFRHFY